MSFFDLLKELRKGEPDAKKAVKSMNILGWVCIAIGVWNLVFLFFAPFEEESFNIPESYPYVAIIAMSLVGCLCILSSHGIKKEARWAILAGQSAIVLFIVTICLFALFMFRIKDLLPPILPLRIFFVVVMTFVFGQFLLPALYGIRYLAKLPKKKVNLIEQRFEIDKQETSNANFRDRNAIPQEKQYKDALLPFGIFGSFALLIACLMIPSLIVIKYVGIAIMPVVFLPGFALIFFGPVIYNTLPSPFEKDRKVLSAFTGGGSVFMFSGSWPFFKLLFYEDGIEVRVMLHRFFIPHDKMDNIPEKVGFFSRGILIKSDLPGVPSSMRFMAMGSKKAVQAIVESRRNYLNKEKHMGHP